MRARWIVAAIELVAAIAEPLEEPPGSPLSRATVVERIDPGKAGGDGLARGHTAGLEGGPQLEHIDTRDVDPAGSREAQRTG